MKTGKTIILAIAIALLHTGCQSQDVPEVPEVQAVQDAQEMRLNAQYDHVGSLDNPRLIAVGKNKGTAAAPDYVYGFVTAQGRAVTPLQYEGIGNAFENRAAFKRQGLWGFVDENGREVVAAQYDRVEAFHNGRAQVVRDKKSGFIDASGKLRVPMAYDHAQACDENKRCQVGRIIAVRGNMNINQYGLIDDEGKTIAPMVYDDISIFYNDAQPAIAVVKIKNKVGLMDVQGQLLIPVQYDHIEVYPGLQTHNLVRVRQHGKWGLMQLQGKWVLPAEYDVIRDAEDGRIEVEKNGKTFHVNTQGHIVP